MNDPLLPRRALIPAAATAANISAGFLAMLAAAEGRPRAAVYLLLLAILLDMTDGRLARRLSATSDFGQQLDSLSDALSFGIAPAFLIYTVTLSDLGPIGALVAIAYVLAGVFRLARFNLLSNAHEKARRTLGVPVPIAAGYLMAAALMRDALAPWAAAAVVLAMAAGMVSRWRLPDLKGKGLVSAMLLVGLLNYFAVVVRPGWPTVIWWNVWNLAILIAAALEDRRGIGAEADDQDPARHRGAGHREVLEIDTLQPKDGPLAS